MTAIVEGHADLADIAFLVAVIVAIIGTILYVQAKTIAAALVSVAVAAIAFGFLVL